MFLESVQLAEKEVAATGKWLQLVFCFVLKTSAVDTVTPQGNFTMWVNSSPEGHSNNLSSGPGQLQHFFCLATSVARWVGYMNWSLAVSKKVGCEQLSKDLTGILRQESQDLGPKGYSPALFSSHSGHPLPFQDSYHSVDDNFYKCIPLPCMWLWPSVVILYSRYLIPSFCECVRTHLCFSAGMVILPPGSPTQQRKRNHFSTSWCSTF